MIARYWLCFAIAITPATAQVSEAAILLAKVKSTMREHLRNVPNYTCLETVERYQKRPGAAKPFLIDVLRLEVAFVGGQELFAWPGSAKFEDRDFREVVSTGAFGTGNFVLHARGLFLVEGPRFEYLGLDMLEGRAAYKFSYETPLFRSGYQIRNQSKGLSQEVAHHGFFWVDRTSLELIRLSVKAQDIPVLLEISAAVDQLDYAMIPLGGGQALLPKQSELRLTDAQGVESINRMRLTRCKQFAGESSISFDDVAEENKGGLQAKQRIELAAGMSLELALENEITNEQAAVGDAIRATLRQDLRAGKELIFPKGSIATGRIVELAHHAKPDCFTVAFLMEEISSADRVAELKLRLLRTEPQSGPPNEAFERRGNRLSLEYPIPSRNGFVWFRPQLKLGRGFATIWETQTVAP